MPKKLIDLDLLKDFRQEYDTRLKNGTLVPSKALTAKELETVSAESGDTQETPFILQGTGTANGTSSVDTGTVGKHIQKQGSVYCVNQLVNNGNFESTSGWTTTAGSSLSVANNIASIILDGTQTISYGGAKRDITLVNTHKVLIKVDMWEDNTAYSNSVKGSVGLNGTSAQSLVNLDLTQTRTTYYIIQTINNGGVGVNLIVGGYASGTKTGTIYVSNLEVIDLTQWFNGNIPTSLTADNFSLYHNYGDYIPYNTGELVASAGRYLVNGERNIWDEEWETGMYDSATGQKADNSNIVRCKNPIVVIPNTSYFVKAPSGQSIKILFYDENNNYLSYVSISTNSTFTTPSNCSYITFNTTTTYGGTYHNDITISLYYAGEDYSQYYPYEQPKVYDTGTETLLSTGVKLSVSGEREDIYDYKEPDGTITRRVGVVDLGTLTWYKDSNTKVSCSISTLKPTSSNADIINAIVVGWKAVSYSATSSSTSEHEFACSNSTTTLAFYSQTAFVNLTAAQIKEYFSGLYLYFELATPTTEQGTPFSENIEIDDFGTMGWYSAYTDSNTNTLASVPQGCKIFYPAWYVGFIDTLGQRADIDWNANNVVSQNELSASETARDTIDSQLKNAIGGTLRHMISGVDFNNSDLIDLSDLTYTRTGSGLFQANSIVSNMKAPADNETPANIVCTKYQTYKFNVMYGPLSPTPGPNMAIAISNTGYIYINDSSYTDATTFKNAMKGVLLAYEKA